MIRPLRLVVTALIFATAATAWAQQRGSVPIVGVLRTSSFIANDPSTEALKRALREFGYVEGQNIKLVRPFAEGQLDRLPQLAQDLVQLNVDVILAPNHAAVRAAKQATTTIPIVMVLYDYDPVASGLIQSLSRPGGNVTGIFSLQPEELPTEGAVSALNIPHASMVFDLYETIDITAELLDGGGVTKERVRDADVVCFTCLKVLAFDQRGERKDAHDPVYCLEHGEDGIAGAIKRFRHRLAEGRHAEVINRCLDLLAARFAGDRETEGYRKTGPVAVARFEQSDEEGAAARDARILRQR